MNNSLATPQLPNGYELDLPGRGRTFIRDAQGPEGAPTIILLHGWTATADLNWYTCFAELSKHFRVLAPDHRGHGRGIQPNGPFRLEDCADDAAAIADVLGINTFIPVGYSMGGTIAQLLWKRHQSRVRGLVLCSTSGYFASSREERLSFLGLTGLAALARLTPAQATVWLTEQIYLQRKSEGLSAWAIAEMASHNWRHILEAGRAIGSFNSREWLGGVDVPTSVLVTTKDLVVPTKRQYEMHEQISGAELLQIDAGHDAVYAKATQYVPLLVGACVSVHQNSLN